MHMLGSWDVDPGSLTVEPGISIMYLMVLLQLDTSHALNGAALEAMAVPSIASLGAGQEDGYQEKGKH